MFERSVERLGAIVLAAGESKRFGETNKLHELIDGGTVAECVLKTVASIGFGRRVAVGASGDERLAKVAEQFGFELVKNQNPAGGIASSIALGIEQMDAMVGVIVFLGDLPFVKPSTFLRLVDVFYENDAKNIVRPACQGQPGHPVIFPARFATALSKLEGDEGAKSLIEENRSVLTVVDSSDRGTVADIDVQSDLL